MAGVLDAHNIGVGAAVGLCLDSSGHMFLGVNTPEVLCLNLDLHVLICRSQKIYSVPWLSYIR